MTVLLNLEFSGLWPPFKDKGYSSQKDLREFISKTWNEEKDFEILIGKCVDYLK